MERLKKQLERSSNFGGIADQVLARQASLEQSFGGSQDKDPTIQLPPDYALDDAAQIAYEALLDNTPVVFLTGRAGTGTTTFIEYIRQNLERNSVVLAPTGVAALNVGGQTIHSFFKFPPRLRAGVRFIECAALFQSPSSRGLGLQVFILATGVRLP